MLPQFLKRRALKKPIHFALSYDEEVGCIGAHSLAAAMAREVPQPRAIIIGEPTMMTVVHAHKGAQMYVTKFTGFEAHSSMTHLGVSAIHFAGEFVHYLNTVQDELDKQFPPTSEFTPPAPTFNVGTIVGGTAGNILARECEVLWGYRELPDRPLAALGDRALQWLKDELLPKMKAKHPAAVDRHGGALLDRRLLAGGQRGRQGAGGQLVRLEHRGQRRLRHRGRHLPQDARRADGGLRAGRHRPGAPAQRVHPRLADHRVRGLHEADGGVGQPMKIKSYETFKCDAGWRTFSFLKMVTDGGIVGWSEYNESFGSPGLSGVIEALMPSVIGMDPMALELINAVLATRSTQSRGGVVRQAIAAIENALLDIKGKALGVPVYQLFGGKLRDRIPVYWSHCGSYRMRNADLVGEPAVRTYDDMTKVGAEVKAKGFTRAQDQHRDRDRRQADQAYRPGLRASAAAFPSATGTPSSPAAPRRRSRPSARAAGPMSASCSTPTSISAPKGSGASPRRSGRPSSPGSSSTRTIRSRSR